jgi:DNA excision repair protein ERCC-6
MENFSVPIVQGGYSNANEIQVQTAYKCASVLKNTIMPFLLRRCKQEVQYATRLPSKNEQVLFCRLSEAQKDEYIQYLSSKECRYIIDQNQYEHKSNNNRYNNGVGKGNKILKALTHLRKICNHVDLVTNKHYNSIENDNQNQNVDETSRM